jgi:hypothetical protein
VLVEFADRAFRERGRVVDAHPGIGLADRAGRGAVLPDDDHREFARPEAVDHPAPEAPRELGDVAIGGLVAERHPQGGVRVVRPFGGGQDQGEGLADVVQVGHPVAAHVLDEA